MTISLVKYFTITYLRYSQVGYVTIFVIFTKALHILMTNKVFITAMSFVRGSWCLIMYRQVHSWHLPHCKCGPSHEKGDIVH